MRHQHRRNAILITALLTMASALLSNCASTRLPRRAQEALDQHIAELVDAAYDYEIVSAQKAAGPSLTIEIKTVLGSRSDAVSGCPPDSGAKETWCVVIAPPIPEESDQTVSHFLIGIQGRFLDVEHLADTEANAFIRAGCDNWDTDQKE